MSNHTTSTNTNTSTSADPRPLLDRAITTALTVVDGITPDQLHLPTPCDDFDVEQLLGHIAVALGRVAACGRGDVLGMQDELVTSDDWQRDLRRYGAEATDAWADAERLAATVELPWAAMTGAEAVAIYTNEVTVHTWDVAVATGQTVAWDDEVVATCQAAIHSQLPLADRDAMWAAFLEGMPAGMDFSAPFANAQPVADGATPIERLVAWNGRRPAGG